jgi:hypothetical protein
MRLGTIFGVSALLISCDDGGKPATVDTSPPLQQDTYQPQTDADGDGYFAEEDCDDNNSDVHPGQEDVCNGVDDNCNGVVDEGFGDADSDGVADCMDAEDCDGLDNDGDGEVDEDFEDSDSDGIADCMGTEECNGVDDDGDGEVDEGYDYDGDGYTVCGDEKTPADCDDKRADVNPGESEVDGDNVDNDCDGATDEGAWRLGDVFITEVMANPARVSDPEGEWFEIKNDSGRDIDINGLIIGSDSDGDYHQIASLSPIIVPDGEFAVLASNSDYATNGEVSAVYEYGDEISMSNEADDLWLMINDLVIDKVEWDGGKEYPDPSGASLALDPDYFSSSLNDIPEGWCQAIVEWGDRTDLGYPNETNQICQPIAAIALLTSGTLYTCTEFTLDASGSSTVPDTDLEYSWELVSAPSGSALTSADITEADTVTPSFIPDEPGSYTFSLTLFNGYEYSSPATITVTVEERSTNTDPSSDAGTDQAYSEASVCWPASYGAYYTCNDCTEYEFELDGSGSYDADRDAFTYAWTITDGAAYATIANDRTETPTVTVSGVGTSYGTANTVTVEVTLTTTDCMGATNTDTVDLAYTCDGS